MIFYWLFFCLVIASFAANRKLSRIIFSAALFLASTLLVGLRGRSVGTDTNAYYLIYEAVRVSGGDPSSARVEPLYFYLNYIFNFFTSNAAYMILFISAIIFFSFSLYIYRYSKSIAVSWLIFLVLGSFFPAHNIMRQDLALAVILFSLPAIFNRKPVTFFFIVLIATGMHVSAIVFAPVYFLYRKHFNLILISLIWIVTLPLIFIPELSQDLFFSIGSFLPDNYSGYLHDPRVIQGFSGDEGLGLSRFFYPLIFIYIIVCAFCLNKNKQINEKKDIYNFFINISMLYLILINVFYNLTIVSRIIIYMEPSILIAIPIATVLAFNRKSVIITYTIVLISSLFLFAHSLNNNPAGVFPYTISRVWKGL